MKSLLAVLVLFSVINISTAQDTLTQAVSFPKLKGEYLGQELPGKHPVVFAPGVVSTKGNIEGGQTFSTDGKEFYFVRTEGLNPHAKASIMVTRMIDSVWSEPQVAAFSGVYADFEPHISPDGKKFYFNRLNLSDNNFNNGIWVMEREKDKWSEPKFFRPGMFITETKNGTIYYTDIANPDRDFAYAEFINGNYDSVKGIPGVDSEFFDAHPCIAPDESFIVFDSKRPDRNSPWELYAAFKTVDGNWSKSYSLSSCLGEGYQMQASLSPDGKYLFYHSNGDIYWIDAKVLKSVIPVEQ